MGTYDPNSLFGYGIKLERLEKELNELREVLQKLIIGEPNKEISEFNHNLLKIFEGKK